jgi:hypothetical protein
MMASKKQGDAQYITKDIPRIYVLDYGGHLDRLDEAVERLKEAPVQWLHVHCDMPYLSRSGSSTIISLVYPMPWALSCDADRVAKDTVEVRDWVSRAHDAGVECIFPYICNQTMGGDPDARTGMWWFYDHWDEFTHDVGPKPAVDPIDWQQREPDGRIHYNYSYRFPICDPPIRFAPCPNNPYWHDWLKVNVRLLAEYGYDGVFVDNNIIHCHCEHCQAGFREYLAEAYSSDELKARYGSDDVSSFEIATLGDKVLWACAQPEYRASLLEADRDVFVKEFGTDDVETAIMSEAGNGFHWGRSNDWWRAMVRNQNTEVEVDRIFREGDATLLGIIRSEDLCLWADTQKFRAWSHGQRNAELRAAAEEIKPGFVMVPNWGDLTGFDQVNGRRVDGKNVLLNAPGSDVVFYEFEMYPGTVAPGYTFDLMLPYGYTAVCGARSVALPYYGSDHRALVELATVEAAAYGGDAMYAVPTYTYSDIRQAYAGLFGDLTEWYQGRSPHARVGVCMSFDEIHLENVHHFAEVSMTARYFANHGVPIVFVSEQQVVLDHLRQFDLVAVPHIQYLPTAAREALVAYASEGGHVLITGNTGVFDEHAHSVEPLQAAEFGDNGIQIDWIENWQPRRSMQIHDLMDYHIGKDRLPEEVIPKLLKSSQTEPLRDTRLLERCEALVGEQLRVLGTDVPPTLRPSLWQHSAPSGAENGSLVLHLVNYDAPGPTTPDGRVVPVENVAVSVPVPDGMTVTSVVTADAWHPVPDSVEFIVEAGRVTFTLPRVDAYRVVRIS